MYRWSDKGMSRLWQFVAAGDKSTCKNAFEESCYSLIITNGITFPGIQNTGILKSDKAITNFLQRILTLKESVLIHFIIHNSTLSSLIRKRFCVFDITYIPSNKDIVTSRVKPSTHLNGFRCISKRILSTICFGEAHSWTSLLMTLFVLSYVRNRI